MDTVQTDIDAVQSIAAIPRILAVIAASTGMRFVAVARVTATNWTACAVLDDLSFGVKVGDELPIDTTLCTEVRSSKSEVVIDDVTADHRYADHCSPSTYGYRSYASFPIVLPNGEILERSVRSTQSPVF